MKRKTTQTITTIAVLLSLVLLVGFVFAIQNFYAEANERELAEPAPPEKGTIDRGDMTVVAMGDSLTRGTGDDSGKGYVGFVSENLKDRLKPQEITVRNLGINGQTSGNLLKQIDQPNIQKQIAEADVILMTIGGNDLFQKGETILHLNLEKVQQLQQQYLANLEQIFTKIRNQNKLATVFILGLYNPFIEFDESDTTNGIVRAWNHATETVAGKFKKIVFVPTFDLFQLSVNDYLYSDHFHPNQAGYQLISDRLAPLIQWEKEVDENG